MDLKVFSNEEIKPVLDMAEVIACVESVYTQKAQDETVVWPTTFYEFDPGHADMDIKSGYLKGAKLFGHKTVAWVEANIEKGLPDLNGLIVVYSSETGMPLGAFEASYITGMRTGASAAVGAKYLARKNSENLLLVGTGAQAFFMVWATLVAMPGIKHVLVANPRTPEHADAFVEALPAKLAAVGVSCEGIDFTAVGVQEGCENADIILTATSAREPLIKKEWVKMGTHFSCIGADMSGKQEIDEALFLNAAVYCDDLVHCAVAGEMEKALATGVIQKSDVQGELGSLILGQSVGRLCDKQTTIFDATGMALLDIACAAILLK